MLTNILIVVWGILFPLAILFNSIVLVKTGTFAVTFLFGRFSRILKPGLNFKIPVFETIEKLSAQTHQQELPDDPEKIDRTDPVEPGKMPPYRVLHSGKDDAWFYENEGDNSEPNYVLKRYSELGRAHKTSLAIDSLNAPLTSEIAVVVEWFLDPNDRSSIKDFIQNISTANGRSRVEEVRKRVDDMVSRALQELLGIVTLGHSREMITLFSQKIEEKVKILVGEIADPDTGRSNKHWGIQINAAYIKSISAGHRINTARADAAAKVSTKAGTISDAEAKAQERKLQAAAEAYAETQKGKGEAGRIVHVTKAMEDPEARFVATLDVAETVAKEANFMIVPQEGGMVASIAAIAKGAIQASKEGDS